MMMQNYPKPIKRLLREYLGKAYERELQRELAKLDKSFAEWRSGQLSSGELSEGIHRYETGPSRELFKRYNDGPVDMNVAYAIVVGMLDQAEVPPELLEAISRPISFYRHMQEQNQLREPD